MLSANSVGETGQGDGETGLVVSSWWLVGLMGKSYRPVEPRLRNLFLY